MDGIRTPEGGVKNRTQGVRLLTLTHYPASSVGEASAEGFEPAFDVQ